MSDPALPTGSAGQLAALHGPLTPYGVGELLLASRVPLDAGAVTRALGARSGAVDVGGLPEGAFRLAYLDHRTDFRDAKQKPMVHLVT